MELDAPCKGLKAAAFRAMLIGVASLFWQQALLQFGKKGLSLCKLFHHVSLILVDSVRRFKNREDKRAKIVKHCSNLLGLLHQLQHEELESASSSSSLDTASVEKDEMIVSISSAGKTEPKFNGFLCE